MAKQPGKLTEKIKHRHMRQMISDAVDGFETKDAARAALFEALSEICDADQSEMFSNLLGRIAHEKARHDAPAIYSIRPVRITLKADA